MEEIVAAKIGDVITNNKQQIRSAIKFNLPISFIDRRHMQIMAAMDLGENWRKLAAGETLFCINEDKRGDK